MGLPDRDPQRLPANSPLTEVIFAGLIWVRTADGQIYPARRDASHGVLPGALGPAFEPLTRKGLVGWGNGIDGG